MTVSSTLTAHSPPEHGARPARQEGLLALQRFGVGHNHLRRHVEAGQRLLGQRAFQTVGQLLQGPQKSLLIGHLHRVVPRLRQRDVCWQNVRIMNNMYQYLLFCCLYWPMWGWTLFDLLP